MRLSSAKAGTGEFKTLTGGHILHVPIEHDELAPLNEPCTLAIRPEHVVVRDTANGATNAVPARVSELNFAGATSSIRLDADGLPLEALTLETHGLAVGDKRVVVLPPEKISLLRND
jgi:ABC-type Fe3+/spermidine/putrescine transport system ATPase subunit